MLPWKGENSDSGREIAQVLLKIQWVKHAIDSSPSKPDWSSAIITMPKVIWGIKSLKPYKYIGRYSIYTGVHLQKGVGILAPFFCSLIRTSEAFWIILTRGNLSKLSSYQNRGAHYNWTGNRGGQCAIVRFKDYGRDPFILSVQEFPKEAF